MTDAKVCDENLMLEYKLGNSHAFQVLYLKHKGPLYRYFLRQINNRETAEELFQDTWIKIINARKKYTVQAKFTTFLYQVAHNHLVDYYRKNYRRTAFQFTDIEEEHDLSSDPKNEPLQLIESNKKIEALLIAIDNLPAPQREAFILREEAGMGIDEIAQTTGVNQETAKSRLRYAVKKLRQTLGVCI